MTLLLKEQKELFVLGLKGGLVGEIYAVTAVLVAAFFAGQACTRLLGRALPFWADFTLNWLVLLAAITVYSNLISSLYALVLFPAVVAIVLARNGNRLALSEKPLQRNSSLPIKPFITAYRAQMLVITCLAILAVDFRIFPRRFAKVETWGTSMMDLGVGSFVFSMGLVHLRLILAKSQVSAESYGRRIFAGFRSASPLLVLGFARLLSVKSLQYPEHVTEYGVHWNFFVTLGCLPVLLAVLEPTMKYVPRLVLALVIGALYEVALHHGLLQWVLREDNRYASLITQNKEGLVSFIGYFCIFVLGQSFGPFVLTAKPSPWNLVLFPSSERVVSKQKKLGSYAKLAMVTTTQGLMVASVVYLAAFEWLRQSLYITQPSRRLANLSYVLWTVLYNAVLLLGYNVVAWILPQAVGGTLDAINRNGLAIFLIANLLTGAINLSVNTLTAGPLQAFAILVGYSLVLALISTELHRRKIYIKI